MNLQEKIKHFFDLISDFLAKVPHEIKIFANNAIDIVEQVKKGFESQTAIVITELIPGTWDDEVRKDAIILLSGALVLLDRVSTCIDDFNAIKMAKNGIYQQLASNLVSVQDRQQMEPNKYDTYTQIVYSKKKQE